MTTIFGSPRLFVSADSRWSYKCGKPDDNAKLRKYIVCGQELHLYAGDEVPIILDQAFAMEIISSDEYIELNSAMLFMNGDSEPEMQGVILNIVDGEAIDLEDISGSVIIRYNAGCEKIVKQHRFFHMGSGGEFAKDFFYYSHKKKKKSIHLCNIVGAQKFASHKDLATGGSVFSYVWQQSRYFVRNTSSPVLKSDDNDYAAYIRTRILELKAEMEPMDKSASTKTNEASSAFVSQLRSGSSAGLKKVTMSSVTRRAEKAKARKSLSQDKS